MGDIPLLLDMPMDIPHLLLLILPMPMLPLLPPMLPMAMLLLLRVLPSLCVAMELLPPLAPLFPMAMLPVDAMLLTLLELFMLPRGKLRLMLMLSTGLMDTEVMDMEDTPLLDTEVLDIPGHMDSAMDTLTMVKPEYFLSQNNLEN